MILDNCEIYGDPEGRRQALALIGEIQSKADLMKELKEPESACQVDPMVQEIDALMGRLIRLMTWRDCDAPGTAELIIRQDETGLSSRWWARFDGECPLFGHPKETGWSTARDYNKGYAMALAVALAAEKVLNDEPLAKVADAFTEKRVCDAEKFGEPGTCGRPLPCKWHKLKCDGCGEPEHYGGKPGKDCGLPWPG